MEEKELISNAQAGDIEAFSELVRRYQVNVRSCLAVRLNSRVESEDLAQEAFVIAFRKLADFDATKAFGPWVRTIALNLLKNYWRKHKPDAVGSAAELEAIINQKINSQYAAGNEEETMAALKSCVKKLDAKMQKIVKLHYVERMPLKELTDNLNIKHSAMTMRMHRMRDQLRKCINERLGECPI
jgi:RNA polymerase sigma-70 factor, ECF subfamily